MQKAREGEFVFPGDKKGKPLSNMALLVLLKRMGRSDITAHGFRSTFRDWVAEKSSYTRDEAEMALAHALLLPFALWFALLVPRGPLLCLYWPK